MLSEEEFCQGVSSRFDRSIVVRLRDRGDGCRRPPGLRKEGRRRQPSGHAERCLPESVRGPVERRELARLMAVRDAIGVADMGFLATGIACARGAGWRGVREVLIGKRRVWREAGDCRYTGAKKIGSLHDPVGSRFAPT